MSCVGHLTRPVREWSIGGVPITMLMNIEERKGKEKAVIQKALVDLQGSPFTFFQSKRKEWELEDHYRYPGPIQFFGEEALSFAVPLSLQV